jgi:hypothetical protein
MQRFLILAAAATVTTFGLALAAQVPMPLPRPAIEKLAPQPAARPPGKTAARSRQVPQASGPARSSMMPPEDEDATPCTDLLADKIAEVELNASISGTSGDALCGDFAPARVSAINLRDGGRVELRPAAIARCSMALAFAQWVRDDLVRSVAPLGSGLRRIEIAASYSCRPRNNISGARLSEHGLANAIDVGALVLDDGRRIAIDDPNAPQFLFAEMRLSTCKRFTTVLGPGSDAAHANHLHLDLAQRRGGYRMCQWSHAEWLIP